jgi:uncharacterized protein YjeT (DUF2065 family)
MRDALKTCRDYTVLPSNVIRIQFYANRSSGCNKMVSMQKAGSTSGFRRATLAFEVFIPKDHEWGKGGKMHGTLGGSGWGMDRCYGGIRQDICHSSRIMFTARGGGEIYLYTPNSCHQAICAKYPKRMPSWCCTPTFPYGLHIDGDVVKFGKGVWQNVSITTALGVGATSNVTLRINNNSTTITGIPMQLGATQSIRTTMFTTFYGGHTPDWFPKRDTYVLFRNFRYLDLLPYVAPSAAKEMDDDEGALDLLPYVAPSAAKEMDDDEGALDLLPYVAPSAAKEMDDDEGALDLLPYVAPSAAKEMDDDEGALEEL